MKRVLNTETKKYLGKKVRVCGWVNKIRSHGKIIFFDLRDKSGVLQIVFSTNTKEKVYELAEKVRPEWVIEITGEVRKRPKEMINLKLETGEIEVEAEDLEILSKAKTLPFSISTSGYEINEEKRLKYRYLDLRRERLKKNLKIRQKLIQFIREFLIKEGFLEIETPILTKSTPEGARDFLVPARLQPGKFYALPQSPQQYKQMLMIAGTEKYFQIAKCLRDEDPRKDRQAEHTQLDLEMSFVSQKDILNLIERLHLNLVKKLFPKKRIMKFPFPKITYKKAMEKYKSDKPDVRRNKSDPNELAFCFITDFPMFEWHEKEKRPACNASRSDAGRWGAMHHPFTKPQTENTAEIKKNPEKILAHQYDFVLNGYEIGGGSIRTINLDVLLTVFEILGHKRSEIKKQFKHYFEAFSFGVPPHGGIAIGIDRLLATILGELSIREVIAFPKTGDNRDLMMDLPNEVGKEQLKELHIKIAKRRTKK
ncbi:hypothetical protein AMJ49_03650 [Parcubacteria bacterium DG_74_2]|nr:MAG: hypothetical protein AMJ49_03650 [Parcubacteria bacterium DG_74_2]